MHNIIEIQCPQEILLGLHLDAEQFATLVRQEAAMALFSEGKLSSGMAARWLGIPRAYFLLKAMKECKEGGGNNRMGNKAAFGQYLEILEQKRSSPLCSDIVARRGASIIATIMCLTMKTACIISKSDVFAPRWISLWASGGVIFYKEGCIYAS